MASLGIENFTVKSEVIDLAITQLERSLVFFATLKAKNKVSNNSEITYRVPKEHKIVVRLILAYFYK
jgi:hypothetical protein